MKRKYLIILLLVFPLVSCVGLREVNRDEIVKILVFKNIKDSEPTIIMQHSQLERMKNSLDCKNGKILWKGGFPATIIMKSGKEIKIPGFSFYGRFVKFSRTEWCEVDSTTWCEIININKY